MKISALFVGLAIFVGGCGETPSSTSSSSSSPSEQECIDVEAAGDASDRASLAMNRAATASENFDIQGMIQETDTAAAEFHLIANLTEADPRVSNLATLAAGELDEAADALRTAESTGDVAPIYKATSHLEQANEYINQATEAVYATDVTRC